MTKARVQPKKYYHTVEFTGLAQAIVHRVLFEGVHYYPNSHLGTPFRGADKSYYHACGSRGGKYRINIKGTCSKCKKMIGSREKLDTMRGLKQLTAKEDPEAPFRNAIFNAFGWPRPNSGKISNVTP